jgi:hypothetical protein
MSWGTRTPEPVEKDGPTLEQPPSSDVVEQGEQFAAALEAAKLLAAAVGRPDDQVLVNLSGHANPGHGPCAGWSDEAITISVSAVPKAAAPSAALTYS